MWSRQKAATMEPNTSEHARTLNVSKLKIWLHRIRSHFQAFFAAAVERMASDRAVSSKYNLVTQLHLPKIYIAVYMHEYQIRNTRRSPLSHKPTNSPINFSKRNAENKKWNPIQIVEFLLWNGTTAT